MRWHNGAVITSHRSMRNTIARWAYSIAVKIPTGVVLSDSCILIANKTPM
ncbi:MAG TPA: hypothetical protein VGN39_10080 [Terriglobales bacterium]|nr:hypothetical protein [Terriglobales bacterium]